MGLVSRFIVLEGGEGVGKSTQAAALARHLGAVLTREPGGTALGEALRGLLLGSDRPAPVARAETLMMLAARAQHVAEVIEPALARGQDVVCDRYSGSTLAYQGYGRGLDLGEIAGLDRWASGGRAPTSSYFWTCPPRGRGSAGRAPRPTGSKGRATISWSVSRPGSGNWRRLHPGDGKWWTPRARWGRWRRQ